MNSRIGPSPPTPRPLCIATRTVKAQYPFYVFFTLFGCLGGGGLPRGLGHNLLMQFSSLGSLKMEISEPDFFDTLTIQNDQICYVKHVLAPLYVFFTLFGCVWVWLGGGGGSLPFPSLYPLLGLLLVVLCRVDAISCFIRISRDSPIGESQDSPHNTTHMHYHYRIF